jgi:hypothetical protein
MRKLTVLLLAAALVLAFTLPAAAVDNIFGGYWRARAFVNRNFTGEDSTKTKDLTQTDSRTRLYWTAKFSDKFKFINKFEYDWYYGADDETGDIGADGQHVEIKNSYADFDTGPVNWKIGIHNWKVARGFVFSDDFSGATIEYRGDGWVLPFVWVKGYEGGKGSNKNDQDVDYYAVSPRFNYKNWKINPYFLYVYADDGSQWTQTRGTSSVITVNDVGVYFIGADIDVKLGGWGLWGTGIYNGGDVQIAATGTDLDMKGYLFAAGGNGAVGPVGLHGQFFYASGDDNPLDNDNDAFGTPGGNIRGNSYYWAEIMGMGKFDNQTINNGPGNHITNIWAIGGGADYQALENLKLTLDLWYASLVEKTATDDETLGTEIDFVATYKIMPKLNLDLVGAYLFAGDGVYSGASSADPWEIGARLSLSF